MEMHFPVIVIIITTFLLIVTRIVTADGQSKQATIYGEMKELSVTLHCTTHT